MLSIALKALESKSGRFALQCYEGCCRVKVLYVCFPSRRGLKKFKPHILMWHIGVGNCHSLLPLTAMGWPLNYHHVAVVRGWWSAIIIMLLWSGVGGQLLSSCCCGQGLVVSYLIIILLWSGDGGPLCTRSLEGKTWISPSAGGFFFLGSFVFYLSAPLIEFPITSQNTK